MDTRTRHTDYSERVHVVRQEAGLSVGELAIKSGIAYRTLRRRLEGNPGGFTLDELDAIADATGSSFDYLISGVHPIRAVA